MLLSNTHAKLRLERILPFFACLAVYWQPVSPLAIAGVTIIGTWWTENRPGLRQAVDRSELIER